MPRISTRILILLLFFSLSPLIASAKSVTLKHPEPVYKGVFLDSNTVLTGDQLGVLRLWDLQSKKVLWKSDQLGGPVFSLDYSQENKLIAIGLGSSEQSFILAKRRPHKGIEFINQDDIRGPVMVGFSQTENLLGIGSTDGVSRVVQVNEGEVSSMNLVFETALKYQEESSRLSHSGEFFAVPVGAVHDGNSRNPKWQPSILKLFHIESGTEFTSFPIKGTQILDLKFSQDSNRIAARSFAGDWGRPQAQLPGKNTIHIWSIGNRQKLFEMDFREFVNAYAFSETGEELYTGHSDGRILVYNIRNQKMLWQARAHTGSVLDIEFSRDFSQLMTSGADGLVLIQNLK